MQQGRQQLLSATQPRSRRILIVENSRTEALKLSRLCERQGWEAVCASSAKSAMAELDRQLPDLILVGKYLKDMIEASARLREAPTLLLSDEELAIAATSPEPEILLARMRRLLDRAASNMLREGRDSRILAIDNSPTHLEFLVNTLRKDGYEVRKAVTGREGLQRLATENFDCVLVDLVLPDMDGVEVCRRISQARRAETDSIAIVMLTGHESRADMMRGLEAGADDFIGKSSDLAVLKGRLSALLRRKRAEKEVAEARAALSAELGRTNAKLQDANRQLQETQIHLVRSEKMASLGQLVAGIAHEINNPLTFVLTHLYTIENLLVRATSGSRTEASETARGTFEKMSIRLREIRQGLTRVQELVVGLRTFSRLDDGELQTIDLHAAIDSVLLFLGHKMEGRIKLIKRYEAVAPIFCDAGRLSQVVMNLVANAIDAIAGEGEITISTRDAEGQSIISVRDSGARIPEAIRNRIFDPFFTTKPAGQGTGLGLAISSQIMQAHGGSIEVRSEENEGAEFVVRIPRNFEGAKP